MSISDKGQPKDRAPSLLQTIGSVLAAAAGIQSRKNRERDFKQGKAHTFIAVAIVCVAVLVLGLYFIVQIVLRQAGL